MINIVELLTEKNDKNTEFENQISNELESKNQANKILPWANYLNLSLFTIYLELKHKHTHVIRNV